MTTLPTIDQLPAVPDGVDQWDGDAPTDQVVVRWIHPDEWAELGDGRPVLKLYQGIIGRPVVSEDGEECLAVACAAQHLESHGWEIIREDDNKDWAEFYLTPPAGE